VRRTGGGIGYHEGVDWEEGGEIVPEEQSGFGLIEDSSNETS